ncbi:MAG: phosphonate metabolism transcriptional regulator PhnF [Ferrovibrio sp.]|uniref:phosphonate metabolism transcriptional regulator PhnF n=1 Tax=Ferrovibrio sp. TaxID=1917215 RepID=UPI0026149047|nr:phosphonate metabolism transcriptional regulator PhnF [Ferrovibrio sp.]MCW0233848.1 phosphonate metabolism transcriptional regulator PhnF [Ferrovibrio sp.]
MTAAERTTAKTIERGPIERGAGMAVWRQIAAAMETAIRRGDYRPGIQLPTEKQLADRFGVNRHTVRQAMNRLAETGLVSIEQGRGMFVAESSLEYRIGSRTRFTENLLTRQKKPMRELISADQVPAPAEIARALGIPTGAPLWQIETRNHADDRAVSMSSHFFSVDRFPDMPEQFRRAGSITGALKLAGVADYTRRTTRIAAKLIAAGDARLLDLPRTRPVLISETVNVDERGRPVEFVRARFAADHVTLSIEHLE